jgi:hypothetical protein
MLWSGGFDVRPAGLGTGGLKSDGHDFQAVGVKLVAEGLPHGQISGAASIGAPGNHQDLLPTQR